MIGVHVTVPIACWRRGKAREYLETEMLPPPSTCYGFLLSLVGETDRRTHVGARVTVAMITREPQMSVVLRTVWRCKDKNYWIDPNGKHHVVSTTKKERKAFLAWVAEQQWDEPGFNIGQGAGTNARPDYQQLLTGSELVIWLDSTDEHGNANRSTLEQRVQTALDPNARSQIDRFGGLSLGESTHLIDEVKPFAPQDLDGECFVVNQQGRLTLPVWVDHVGSAGTRFTTGDIELRKLLPPKPMELPQINPPE
ncbi:MAG: type I-MYXAN CRISPR-associated protein Cas5/Cmx5/DevS [Planctomycetales bacterium]|nr:type I-MYXAN CRISPR-associated protein Cas5/Cmx5/DevS [Planctomycetales bacterium]